MNGGNTLGTHTDHLPKGEGLGPKKKFSTCPVHLWKLAEITPFRTKSGKNVFVRRFERHKLERYAARSHTGGGKNKSGTFVEFRMYVSCIVYGTFGNHFLSAHTFKNLKDPRRSMWSRQSPLIHRLGFNSPTLTRFVVRHRCVIDLHRRVIGASSTRHRCVVDASSTRHRCVIGASSQPER